MSGDFTRFLNVWCLSSSLYHVSMINTLLSEKHAISVYKLMNYLNKLVYPNGLQALPYWLCFVCAFNIYMSSRS